MDPSAPMQHYGTNQLAPSIGHVKSVARTFRLWKVVNRTFFFHGCGLFVHVPEHLNNYQLDFFIYLFFPKLRIASYTRLLEQKRLLLLAGENSHTLQETTSLLSMSSMPSGKRLQTPQTNVSVPMSGKINPVTFLFFKEKSLLVLGS